jgi:hypothetical protein
VDTTVGRSEPEAETNLATQEVPERPGSDEAEPAAEAESVSFPELNPEPAEFEEDLEPVAWPQILEDCVYLARGRGAFVMNAKGQISEVTGPWPKPKIEPIGARLMKLMDEEERERAKGAPPVTPTLQLGTFCLTGLRVTIAGQDLTVGLIAETPLPAEARPAVEAELRRGKPF